MNTPEGDEKSRINILSIQLEDYFQVGAFKELIDQSQWYRFEQRVQRNVQKTLQLLEQHKIKATFFVSGWIAERSPEIVRTVAEQGHEIASKGYDNLSIRQMSPERFRDDLKRAKEALERASGTRILGYRVARGWFNPADLWALDVLAEEGYAYDSSVRPLFRQYAGQPWRRCVHKHTHREHQIWEVPVSSRRLLGFDLPIAGGNYIRQFPHTLMRREVGKWMKTHDRPFVMYFHVWELDSEQPKIRSVSYLTKLRHYRNLGKPNWILEDYFERYRFTSIADYLKLKLDAHHSAAPSAIIDHGPATVLQGVHLAESDVAHQPGSCTTASHLPPRHRNPITIVIPCYNEESILPYLANTLRSVREILGDDFDLSFVFVDDGSADETWESLNRIFGTLPGVTLLRHAANRGVTAAILTGTREAKTEIVCSIDCDCTYDPHELAVMIPLLAPGVDLVTASPYHPRGSVRNVPAWRLTLSRGASFLYRQVLQQKLYTYTSCFRVFRRSAILDLSIKRAGFLGVAEIIGQLDLQGSKIVEHPTTLAVRVFGFSKMRTLWTILGHLGLLQDLLRKRLTDRFRKRKLSPAVESTSHHQAMLVDSTNARGTIA
jgi:polysaccharide deacetylase family protein (PEP-CTERM system associated)